MRDPADYKGTYGARFLQWNAALNALIEGAGFKETEYKEWHNIKEYFLAERKFAEEINSQITNYGKKETLRVVSFLIDLLNNELEEKDMSNKGLTEEQKNFLLSINTPNRKNIANDARNKLEKAYCKCDWQCM